MSSPNLGTLCGANRWQCEGKNVLCEHPDQCDAGGGLRFLRGSNGHSHSTRTKHKQRLPWLKVPTPPTQKDANCDHPFACTSQSLVDEDDGEPRWNYTVALDVWSRSWPLERHVLLEKTPNQWLRIQSMARLIHEAPIPPPMVHQNIDRLQVKVIVMWRPWCLASLSGHARQEMARNYSAWADKELVRLNSKFVTRHRGLVDAGVPVLVIAYSDLLFRGQTTVGRLQQFLPCLGKLDRSFVPRIGRDIFPGNKWKVEGSVADFSRHIAAKKKLLASDGLTCRAQGGRGFDALPRAQRAAAQESEEYLRAHSRTRSQPRPEGAPRRQASLSTLLNTSRHSAAPSLLPR